MVRIFYFIAILFTTFSVGQSILSNEKHIDLSADEKIEMTFNANNLVTGEKLLYKINCISVSNTKPSQISKVGHVLLLDSDKKIMFNHKIYFENGQGQGDFFIPATFPTGNYKIVAYTNWMLNQPVSQLFQAYFTVINPFQSIANNDIQSAKKILYQPNMETKSEFIDFDFGSKKVQKREKINLKIKTTNQEKGVFCISIRKKDSLSQGVFPNLNGLTTQLKTNKNPNTSIILPEIRGEIYSGKITNLKNPEDIANKAIAMTVPGSTFLFKTARTNVKGEFVFSVFKKLENPTTLFKVVESNFEDFSLVLNPDPMPNLALIDVNNSIQIPSNLKNTILHRSIATQIENAYFDSKKDEIQSFELPNPFYQGFEKEYILDDFTKFPTLQETIVEVATELNYKQKNTDFQLFAKNKNTNDNMDSPALVFVDGYMIQDLKPLFNYRVGNIYKISTTLGNLFYDGVLNSNGVVSITTRNTDYQYLEKASFQQQVQVIRPLPEKTYYEPKYQINKDLTTIPDYRYQLLWQPNLELNQNEKEISFYTSDIRGDFEIRIEGTTQSGKKVTVNHSFIVN